MRSRRWRPRAAALALGLLPLLAAECGLRLHTRSQTFADGATGQDLIFGHGEGRHDLVLFTPDPDLLWRYRRGVKVDFPAYTVETTRRGFRRTPHTPDDGEPLRVVCLGDSRTMGAGVEAQDTYPAQLEPMLEQRLGRPVHVTNLGVDGYSTFHGRTLGALEVARLDPDVVTAAFGVNDASYDCDTDHATRAAAQARGRAALHDRLNRSELFRWSRGLALSLRSYQPDPGPGPVVANVCLHDHGANLRAMAGQAATGGWSLLVVRIPLGHHLGHAEADDFSADVGRYADRAREVCAADGIPWVDTAPALVAVPRDEGWVEMIHPAAAGQRAVAEAIAGGIEPLVAP